MSTQRDVSQRSRVPEGVPTGGEFANEVHAEPDYSGLGGFFDTMTGDAVQAPQPHQPSTEYVVRLDRLDEAKAAIVKANKRLKREGIDDQFTYDTDVTHRTRKPTEEEVRRWGFKPDELIDDSTATLKLNQPAIKHEGWTFGASVRTIPSTDEVIVSSSKGVDFGGWRPTPGLCEHCGQSRHRKQTYVLIADDGTRKQVGSTCVEAFLGVKPAGLWSLGWEPRLPKEGHDDDERGGPRPEQVYDARETLAQALAVSDGGRNFMSKSKSYGTDEFPTIDHLESAFYPSRGEVDPEMADLAKQYLKDGTVDEVIASARGTNRDSDYGANLNAVLDAGFSSGRDKALLISSLSAYGRQRRRQQLEAVAEKYPFTPGHLAPERERVHGVGAVVTGIRHFQSTFNGHERTTTYVSMRAESGHEVLWKASKWIDIDEGTDVTFDATVKKHSQFKGKDQTEITRANLSEVAH